MFKKGKARDVEDRITGEISANTDELFVRVRYNPEAAEHTGFSNYSYWNSTLKVFMKNRAAVYLLILLAVLVGFTFLQPRLPGQYDANTVNNHPQTGMQLSNQAPGFGTKLMDAPAGITLIATPVKGDADWLAVTNVLESINARDPFTILEYGDEWCKVAHMGREGYIKNSFAAKLKLPDDPAATPYESRSNFPLSLHIAPMDYSNAGAAMYVRASDVEVDDEGYMVTLCDTGFHVLPSDNAFWFGTNNIGQDLWARVWAGTRTSLFIGFMAALVAAILVIFVGVVWGYVRKLDRVVTEVYNVLDNIPTTIVLILIAYIMKPSIFSLILAMCITEWLGMARFIRNQIVIIRDRDYNMASRCLGSGTFRIITRNLLPYLVSVIMMRMAIAIPVAIGSEVFITYIGLGLPVDTPSLGNLINEGRKLIATASLRYQLWFPAIVLSIVTISFYIIGNAFADAADPRNHV